MGCINWEVVFLLFLEYLPAYLICYWWSVLGKKIIISILTWYNLEITIFNFCQRIILVRTMQANIYQWHLLHERTLLTIRFWKFSHNVVFSTSYIDRKNIILQIFAQMIQKNTCTLLYMVCTRLPKWKLGPSRRFILNRITNTGEGHTLSSSSKKRLSKKAALLLWQFLSTFSNTCTPFWNI